MYITKNLYSELINGRLPNQKYIQGKIPSHNSIKMMANRAFVLLLLSNRQTHICCLVSLNMRASE